MESLKYEDIFLRAFILIPLPFP